PEPPRRCSAPTAPTNPHRRNAIHTLRPAPPPLRPSARRRRRRRRPSRRDLTMELSLVSARPLPRAAASPLLFAPLKPLPLLRFPPRKRTAFARLRSRRSRRVAASGEGEGDAADRDEEVFGGRSEQVFGGRRELTGVQPLVEALPPV
uniref:Uncharacterized protein n=1 Tax=Aegilops tauschii subsp. strangulata TaxID=200361 RepID=A0A452YLA7_AEGTS